MQAFNDLLLQQYPRNQFLDSTFYPHPSAQGQDEQGELNPHWHQLYPSLGCTAGSWLIMEKFKHPSYSHVHSQTCAYTEEPTIQGINKLLQSLQADPTVKYRTVHMYHRIYSYIYLQYTYSYLFPFARTLILRAINIRVC